MPLLAVAMLIVYLICIGASVWLIVAAYRVRPWWALVTLLPFGSLVFAVKHWQKARAPFLTVVICGGILGGVISARPEFLAQIKQFGATHRQGGAFGNPTATVPQGPRDPREVRDLAENDASPAAPVPSLAAANAPGARAAYVKHHAELTALYKRLAKERASLKPGKATANFNGKAARYQDALKSLADEKARLDALEHPAAVAPPMKKGPATQAGAVGGVLRVAGRQDAGAASKRSAAGDLTRSSNEIIASVQASPSSAKNPVQNPRGEH
jgi:hypothetical protein